MSEFSINQRVFNIIHKKEMRVLRILPNGKILCEDDDGNQYLCEPDNLRWTAGDMLEREG